MHIQVKKCCKFDQIFSFFVHKQKVLFSKCQIVIWKAFSFLLLKLLFAYRCWYRKQSYWVSISVFKLYEIAGKRGIWNEPKVLEWSLFSTCSKKLDSLSIIIKQGCAKSDRMKECVANEFQTKDCKHFQVKTNSTTKDLKSDRAKKSRFSRHVKNALANLSQKYFFHS